MKKDDILNVSNEEKRIAFDLYQALKDIEEQYTGETIAGDRDWETFNMSSFFITTNNIYIFLED